MDRFASVPKPLLRTVCEAFQTPAVSIASLRSLYARRQYVSTAPLAHGTDLDAKGVGSMIPGIEIADGRRPAGLLLELPTPNRPVRTSA